MRLSEVFEGVGLLMYFCTVSSAKGRKSVWVAREREKREKWRGSRVTTYCSCFFLCCMVLVGRRRRRVEEG